MLRRIEALTLFYFYQPKGENAPAASGTNISAEDGQFVFSSKNSPPRETYKRSDSGILKYSQYQQCEDGDVPVSTFVDIATENSPVAPSPNHSPIEDDDDQSSIPENPRVQHKDVYVPVSTLTDQSAHYSQVIPSSKDSPMREIDHSSISTNLQAQHKDEDVPVSTLPDKSTEDSQVYLSSEDSPMRDVNVHSSISENLQAQQKGGSVPVTALTDISTENSQVVTSSKDSPTGEVDSQSSISENLQVQDQSKKEEYYKQQLMLSNKADELIEYLKDLEHSLKNLKEGKNTEILIKAREMHGNVSGQHANIESAKERLNNLRSEHQTAELEKLQEKVDLLTTTFDEVSKLCTAVINDLEGNLKDEFNTAVESFYSWNEEEYKLENLQAYRERQKDGRTKMLSVVEAGNQCIANLPEGAETIEDQVKTVKMYWGKFLSKSRRTRRLLGASPGPSPEKPKDQVSLITGLEEGMKRLQSTEVQQEHASVSQGKQTQAAGMLTTTTALALLPGNKDRIFISVDKTADIPTNGGEIELGGCIVIFPFGCFDDVTKVYAKAEIDSSKWPPKYICIAAMLWVECQRKLLAKASVKMQSWCVSGVDSNKTEVHILHQKKDSSTWDVVGTLPLNDLKNFQFDCMDFSPYILGIPESEFPATKLVIDGYVYAGPLNDYTLAFFLQHPLIQQYVREEMARQEHREKLNFNSLMVKIEDKISAYLESTDDNFQFPEAFRESFKVDSVFVRMQRTAFYHSFLNRINNQATLISFKCGVHKNDISADGPHHLRCLWTPFPGEPVEGPEGRDIPQQGPKIREARLEVRGPKIHLSWREPGVGGRFTYCINIYCDGQRCEAQPLETPDTNIDYSKIKPSSKYNCQVWAVNSRGVEGEKTWSNSIQTSAGQRAFADPTSTVTAIDVRKATEHAYTAHLYDDGIYTIDRNRRKGRVLIINNDFRGTQSWREGSEVDVRNMKDLWTKLGLDVITTPNLTAHDMLDSCLLFARDCHDISVVVVIIMSHGGKAEDGKEFCQGKDDAVVLVDDIIALFETATSPHLQGIPKLFMFQACRGREEDVIRDVPDPISEGQPLARQGPDPPLELNPVPRSTAPQRADMLITFPSQSGYMAIRNTRDGSWLMNAITHVFMEHAHDKHILELFTMVNRIVGQRVSRYSTVQISNQQSYLMKDLLLFPGWPI